MAAHAIMKHGLRWRIGNGEHVQVWGDKLPTPSTYKVTSPRMFLQAQTKVSELIDEENASWKSKVVDALFLLHEAKVIKSIPLSVHLPVDKQVWACNSNGVFTVVLIGWQWKCKRGWVMIRAQMVGRIEDFGGRYRSLIRHRKLDTSPRRLAMISSLQKQI